MKSTYSPHDKFKKAYQILGGTSEQEIRERIAELCATPAENVTDKEKKEFRKNMVRTGTQEFRRFLGKALAKVDEMHAQETKVLSDNESK